VFTASSQPYMLHEVLVAGWGCPIGELFDLEALSVQCKKSKRYSFFVASEPCNVCFPTLRFYNTTDRKCKGSWWCGKSTKHYCNPIVHLAQLQISYLIPSAFQISQSLSHPSHHRKRVRQSLSVITTLLHRHQYITPSFSPFFLPFPIRLSQHDQEGP
jgi:hypothetical protein